MMRTVHRWILEQVYAEVIAAGYEDLGRFHVGMFRWPTADGVRPSELADRLQITKQSVNTLLGDMEERGYLKRVPDPIDGRARIVRLTAKGRKLETVTYNAAESAQRQIAELLGPRRFSQFRASLEELVAKLS